MVRSNPSALSRAELCAPGALPSGAKRKGKHFRPAKKGLHFVPEPAQTSFLNRTLSPSSRSSSGVCEPAHRPSSLATTPPVVLPADPVLRDRALSSLGRNGMALLAGALLPDEEAPTDWAVCSTLAAAPVPDFATVPARSKVPPPGRLVPTVRAARPLSGRARSVLGARPAARLAAAVLPMAATMATTPAAWAVGVTSQSSTVPMSARPVQRTAPGTTSLPRSSLPPQTSGMARPVGAMGRKAGDGTRPGIALFGNMAHPGLPWLSAMTPRTGPAGTARYTGAPHPSAGRPSRGQHANGPAVPTRHIARAPYRLQHHVDLAHVGAIGNFGDAAFHGAPRGRDVAGLAVAAGGAGYWAATAAGDVIAYGHARPYGSPAGLAGKARVTAIASTPDGHGYWLVDTTGAVYTFGDAKFFGSLGKTFLTRPVVSMAPTPDGHGYWLVSSGGSVFSFGDAKFFGPSQAPRFPSEVIGIAPTPDGHGYWLATSTGDVYSYGDARFLGSLGKQKTDVSAIVASPQGQGYYILTAHGHVHAFGHATALGSPRLTTGAAASSLATTPDGRGYFVGTSAWPALPPTRNGAMQSAIEPARPPAMPSRTYIGTFMVTCYDLTGPTASGQLAGPQSVAVDPSVIPLGSRIYVDGVGLRVADDTGGAIIGDHVDIWEPTYSQCAQWGVQDRAVYRVNG